MLKLKQNVVDFIKANVKPEFVDHHIEMLIENPPSPTWSSRLWFDSCHTIHGKTIYFNLNKDDFEEVEELKLYVWYPREKFEGNPNKYWLVESDSKKHCKIYTAPYQTERLSPTADYFMYIEPLEVEND